MRSYIFIFLGALLLTMSSCDEDDQNTANPSRVSEIDKQFILTAADDALFQVNAGQVALAGTTLKSIQTYGDEMTRDHTRTGQALQQLAADRQLELPTTLSDDRQQQLDSLSMYSGKTLDTLYLHQMQTAQNRAARLMEIQAAAGNDTELKQWASERLPVVRQFAERVKALRDSLGVN